MTKGFRGPAWLVTAAFLGPGTLTTATLAGQSTGLGLLWALGLSLVLTAGIQLLLVRLVLEKRADFGALIRRELHPRALRWLSVALTALAIGFGNAAYQAGNLTGAALGLASVVPLSTASLGALLAVLAAGLLGTGLRDRLTPLLLALIAVMTGVFLLAALATLGAPRTLAFTPPTGSNGRLALALLGTTVVPYNLFLHGRALLDRLAQAKPTTAADGEALARAARGDTLGAVAAGGLITAAILFLAAGSTGSGSSLERLAAPLTPLLGDAAAPFIALGLFAAGLSSALTAPLAAAWALAGLFRWSPSLDDGRTRATALAVLACGAVGAGFGGQPLELILLAQAANALALPWFVFLLLRLATAQATNPLWRIGPWGLAAGALLLGAGRLLSLF